MKHLLYILSGFLFFTNSFAQLSGDQITTDFVRYERRKSFDKNMRERVINSTFGQPLTKNNEDYYKEACWSISQFLLKSEIIENGFTKLFARYEILDNSTKRAFLEAVYGIYPSEYKKEISQLISKETNARLFAMMALYLYRIEQTMPNAAQLRELMVHQFPQYQTATILQELEKYLFLHTALTKQETPSIIQLFQYQKITGVKMIYSFQRWNRDYPGLAIVQNADGSFAKDSSGKFLVFEQLARSASDLPYFITNGSTPQGIYSIQGTEISHNNLIGPTPNIQLKLPGEADSLFWNSLYDSLLDPLANYLKLLPETWRNYQPITESFYAGKAGRTEIIAHGTTIDPDYYKDKPFFPLTPTMGCLCAKEDWNIFNGKFIKSDQFNLVNTFLSTPGTTGYLMVINIDNQFKKITREEIEKWVSQFETIK